MQPNIKMFGVLRVRRQHMITNMLAGIAYIAMAFAVNDLFAATETSVLGRRRGPVVALLLAGAAVQCGLMLAGYFGFSALTGGLDLLAGLCLLGVPLSLWPVVRRLKHRQMRVMNRRLTQRAARAEAAAVAARKWLGLAEQTAHVGHWQLTVPGNRLVWSDEIYRIHGLWREHYKPRIATALAAFHPVDGKRVAALMQEAVASQGRFEVAGRLRRPDGEIRHVVMRGGAALDRAGRVEALNGVMVDVTEAKRVEAKLLPHAATRELPLEDGLTGLADRRQFDLSLGYEFKRAVRSRKPLGMVLLDIDHFRRFNAHYGELDGDACLRAVAQAVQAMPRRTGDVVARYNGAEIAVLLPLADAAGALRVATQIFEAIRVLGLPNAGHASKLLSVSYGAAAFAGMDDLYNPMELVRRASRALADAKAAGGNRVCSFQAAGLLEALPQRG
jgi:diguanylate cyclase (GGDEF)-like protein/PAS domain S-box-containing protein